MQNVSETSRESGKTPQAGLLAPFDVHVQSGPKAVRTALLEIINGLGPLKLDVEETSTLELVLAEALNNVVEHAYTEPNAAGEIHISLRHRRDGLHVQICDWGNPMPDGVVPLGQLAALDGDVIDLPEGGFGWFLIRDLAKDVVYKRIGAKNQLRLRIAVAYRQGI
ncbi:ATP-binding protein [Sulfitobacter sp. F26204]|uniref:ATP-binding protein n=1 Tax=Sulfitobacter sp. F26204 TaxID=2996014 RepID=UPI00225DE66E|nr:ATP-binding protein [Sulfitobacter sp. F26204]MCX7557997.1 ATP-binding protein [Sulfitobacter sp. F26204]